MVNCWAAWNGYDGWSLSSRPQLPLSRLFLTTTLSLGRGLKWKAMSPPCCWYLRFTANLQPVTCCLAVLFHYSMLTVSSLALSYNKPVIKCTTVNSQHRHICFITIMYNASAVLTVEILSVRLSLSVRCMHACSQMKEPCWFWYHRIKCATLFSSITRPSWSVFVTVSLLETGMNTLQLLRVYLLNRLMTSRLWHIEHRKSSLDRITNEN